MSFQELTDFLDNNDVKYINIQHSKAYSDEEIWASDQIKGGVIAHSCIIKINEIYAMVVVPGKYNADDDLMRQITCEREARIVADNEIKEIYPEFNPAFIPPFGHLLNINLYAAKTLLDHTEFYFCAFSPRDIIKISSEDYKRIAKPLIGKYTINEYYMKFVNASEYFLC
jgi:Ala-tRNA(Pro) deacylase